MLRRYTVLPLILAAALATSGVAASSPQALNQNCQYWNETGHYVCGEFLVFFNTRGSLEIFGYPLTEAFYDPTHRDLYVQYFQRARMEWHPLNQAPYKVQLGLLTDELGCDYPPVQPDQIPPSNGAQHHYFPETNHVVTFAFLDYFRSHGGLDTFGYPRSEFVYEGGRVVQHFQRARMEWHRERVGRSQITLANLGEEYIEKFGIPGNYDEALPPPPRLDVTQGTTSPFDEGAPHARQGVTELRLSASVSSPVTGRQGTQTLFVYVNDQRGQPVEGAFVTVVARYPSNRQHMEFGPTEESGFTSGRFEILPAPPGERVIVDVMVTYQGLKETTQTFFLLWW